MRAPRQLARLLTSDEAAEYLRVSTKTLRKLRRSGLPFAEISPGCHRYREDDLAAYVAAKVISETPPCRTAPKARASGTTTSRSGVVDFTEVVALKTSKRRKP
ncbi:helix-turn-helix domain-containing protein [Sagittula stellata]|uniref:helix-turn-helix domain-containing protein n=1 Tax=Sagittula stellata TaxID=52603 RepID=UPI000A005656|nr:helix-turn-helix domain-containing protein [Sagittula stellata]